MKVIVYTVMCLIIISALFGCGIDSLDIHFAPSPLGTYDDMDSSRVSSSSGLNMEYDNDNNITTEDKLNEREPNSLHIQRIDFDIDYSSYGYEITDNLYSVIIMEDRNWLIDVHYPQLKNPSDKDKEDTINQLLWLGALRGEEELFLHSHDDEMTHYLKVVYNVTYAGENMISVLYRGLGASSQSASSHFLAYGITIDLEDARVVPLNEVIIIDDSIKEKVCTGAFSAYGEHPWDPIFHDERLNIFGGFDESEINSISKGESRISFLFV